MKSLTIIKLLHLQCVIWGLFLDVDGGGGDWKQLLDPGLDGGVGLRTDKAELKIIAGFLPIVGLVCSNVVVWNSAADHLYTRQWKG